MKHTLLVRFSWVCPNPGGWQMMLAGCWLTLLMFAWPVQLRAQYCPNGTIVAGGNGRGAAANQLYNPYGLALDAQGNIYVADYGNNRVQRWAPGATQGTTVAGGNGNGAAANQLDSPVEVAVDAQGNIYVADMNNNRIQRWAPGATQGTTVAGGNGGGSAANQLDGPYGVALDAQGNIYVADLNNHRIQRWAPGATRGTTVAGGNGDGSADNQLNNPYGLALDAQDNVYVADNLNHRIQRWAPGASQGTTVARGNGNGSSPSQVYDPFGVALDAQGNIYVADYAYSRIQRFSTGPVITQQPPTSQRVCAGAALTASVTTSGTVASYQWYQDGASLSGQTAATLTLTNTSPANTGRYVLVLTGSCSLTTTAFDLTVNPAPTLTVSASTTALCAAQTASLTASGASTYQWQGPGGFTSSANPITVSAPGTYSVTGTSAAGCTASVTTNLTAGSPPTPSLINDGPLTCAKPTVNLTAGGGSTYRFSNGTTQSGNSNQAVVSSSGVYSVTVTTANGCSATTQTTVQVDTTLAAPTLTASALSTENVPISVTASGCSGTLTWTAIDGSGTANGAVYTFTQPGNYTLTATCTVGSCISPAAPSLSLQIRPGGFAIRGVELVRCRLVDAGRGQYEVSLTPQYSGLTGLPISFGVTSELAATTAPGPYTLRLYTDNATIALVATQSNAQAGYRYDWLAACTSSQPAPNC